MYKSILTSILFCLALNTIAQDSLNMDAVYNRPIFTPEKSPVAIGGYLEANALFASEEGISEGYSFQARRLTLFLSSSIAKRIKFLTEIELEEGGKKIGIEFAALDLTIHPLLNIRGGIIMNPIGGFNQNHDGPKWEFIDRPEMAVNLLPATLANAGFGLFGKSRISTNWVFGYEAYLTNGFDGSIIDNEEGKTFLPAVKENGARFEESLNGAPLLTGKIVFKNSKAGEIGLSYMGGIYNQFMIEGVEIDKKRSINVWAVDYTLNIPKTNTTVIAEYARVLVDVPGTYGQQYGNQQQGVFVDVIQPILTKKVLNWEKATLNLACRFDYVDWNIGEFKESKSNIGEEILSITPAVSFRPTSQTVFRFNYRYNFSTDILNNTPARGVAYLLGFSTYF